MPEPRGALSSVPEPEPVYGVIDVWFGTNDTRRCTIGVAHAVESIALLEEDILLDPNGWVGRHPLISGRDSTEEERAAVGWTW